MNILIVEDQALIALDLKLILEELNYSVCGVAQNYHQAIDLLETGNPDLVLLDINLNDNKNGIDIAHHINKKIPHVFVTANDDQLMFEKIKETNPYGYINKPFQISDIHSSIEIALNKFKHDQKLKIKQETLSLINNKLEDKIAQNLKESNLLVQHLKQEMILRNNIELELIEKENLSE